MSFPFFPGDLIVMGNEYDGLPDELVAGRMPCCTCPRLRPGCPRSSHSPIDPSRTAPVARDGTPSLNVAMTAGIICYAAYAGWLAV